MPLSELSILPVPEIARLVIILACAVINALTLSDAFKTYRRVLRSQANSGALVYAINSVHCKFAFVLVQLVAIANAIQRLALANDAIEFGYRTSFIISGIEWLAVSLLIAWTAWRNMRTFHRLRDEA